MRIRVFIRPLPPDIKFYELRSILRESTVGSGEILIQEPDEACRFGSCLVSYDSWENAVDAVRRRVVLAGVRLRLNIVDDPRSRPRATQNQTLVIDPEFSYSPTIDIAGNAVEKKILAPTRGLQDALRGYIRPRWCNYTEKSMLCPFGQRCLYIHRKAFQSSELSCSKTGTLFPCRVIELSTLPHLTYLKQEKRMFRSEANPVLYGTHVYIKLTSEDRDTLLSWNQTKDEEKHVKLIRTLQATIKEVQSSSDVGSFFVLSMTTCVPNDTFLAHSTERIRIARQVDDAVVRYCKTKHESPKNAHELEKLLHSISCEDIWNVMLQVLTELSAQSIASENISDALNLLSCSPKVRHALLEPDATIEIRPYYAINPAHEYLVQVKLLLESSKLILNMTHIEPTRLFVFYEMTQEERSNAYATLDQYLKDLTPSIQDHFLRQPKEGEIPEECTFQISLSKKVGTDPPLWLPRILRGVVGWIGHTEFNSTTQGHSTKEGEKVWITNRTHGIKISSLISSPPIRIMRKFAPRPWLDLFDRYCEYRHVREPIS